MASIRVRDGRHQVRWRQDGHAVAETFADRAQARRFLGLVIAAGERHPDGWVPGRGFAHPTPREAGPTLAGWFERAVAARTTANERSKHDMRRDFRLHVPAWLADRPIAAITREEAGLWVNQLRTATRGGAGRLAGTPVSAKTVHNVHGHVSGAMNDAVRDEQCQQHGRITLQEPAGLRSEFDRAGGTLSAELAREIGPGHVLHGQLVGSHAVG
jgi:hypothetical protein